MTIARAGTDAEAQRADERKRKQVMFKNCDCAPFTRCISEINTIQVDNTKDSYVVIQMYNLIEYSNNCANTSVSLWKYYKDVANNLITYS